MLGHACTSCGSASWEGGVRLLDERDWQEDLREQERGAPPEVRELIRLVRERLQVEDAASAEFKANLGRTFERVVETLREAQDGKRSPLAAQILNASVDELGRILESAGVLDARADLKRRYAELVALGNQAPAIQGLPPGTVKLDTGAVRAYVQRTDETFWRGRIVQPAAVTLREGLDRALTLEPLGQTIETLQKRLDTSVGRAATEARTQIATFDRLVNTQVAEDAGLDSWLYLGPVDNLTRPFCRAIVNRVVDFEQAQQLDSGFGSVLLVAGGPNCRHLLAPVSDATVQRRSLQRATADDIAAANAGAARRAA